MLTLRRGEVTAVVARAEGLVRLEVDGRSCIAYPRLTGPVAAGDDVLVNTRALDLDLGSGGFDVLYANLTRGLGRPAEEGSHVMKLPYTPLQHTVRHAEEDLPDPETVPSLAGTPVVCCSLHSQLVPVCAGLGPELAAAYCQLPGGALPVSLSDAVRALKRRGFLDLVVAPGSAVDGDLACVSLASAFTVCRRRSMQVIVCAVGPGITGTGTTLGHGALSVAEAANAAVALGGRPIVVPRISSADTRDRHRGLSHHTLAALELVLGEVSVAWPAGLEAPASLTSVEAVDVSDWQELCAGLPLSHMNRGPEEDPWFFAAAVAAGRLARKMVT